MTQRPERLSKIERYYYYGLEPVTPILVYTRVIAFKCPRCGYTWVPRKTHPKCCPRCSSRLKPQVETEEKDETLEEIARLRTELAQTQRKLEEAQKTIEELKAQ